MPQTDHNCCRVQWREERTWQDVDFKLTSSASRSRVLTIQPQVVDDYSSSAELHSSTGWWHPLTGGYFLKVNVGVNVRGDPLNLQIKTGKLV